MIRKTAPLSRDDALALRAAHYEKARCMAFYQIRRHCCPECRHRRPETFLSAACDRAECTAARDRLAGIGAGETLRTVHAGRRVAIAPDGTVTEDQ